MASLGHSDWSEPIAGVIIQICYTTALLVVYWLVASVLIGRHRITYMLRIGLTHGFRRYTGNIPEVLMNIRPRVVVFVSAEGIPRIPYIASGLTNL